MCFVTYLPTANGYLMGSNRDESALRLSAQPPQSIAGQFGQMLLPRDRKAGGTWIAAREDGYTLVLLNGAYEPHISKPPYRLSRGVIIPTIMQAGEPEVAFAGFYLQGIEPFTLVIAKDNYLEEWRWDGLVAHHKILDASLAHCWSSVTLYAPWQTKLRAQWFMDAVSSGAFLHLPDNLMAWHGRKGRGQATYDIMLNRPDGLITVSTTIVEKCNHKLSMKYCDYLSGFRTKIDLEKAAAKVL